MNNEEKILIKITFPNNCNECNLYDDRWDYPTCFATKTSMGYKFNIFEKKMPNCPLYKYLEK